tara:strand:- start:830 stop:1783 length:954 start_codon:yes stop_codon:yes gene_type:complete
VSDSKTIATAIKTAKDNPIDGTTEQVTTLSISIAKSSNTMDKSVFNLYKEKVGISPKVFSKLKVIGDTLLAVSDAERKGMMDYLPSAYNSLYLICSKLSPDEIRTAIKSKCITKTISYRQTDKYVKQIRYPYKFSTDGDKGRWSIKQEHLFSIFRRDMVVLEGEALERCEDALRKICRDYQLDLRRPKEDSIASIRVEERATKAAFWRRRLEDLITEKWFAEQPMELKKQFNVKKVEEVIDSPLRTFTGFLVRCGCGKAKFFDIWGKAYIAKIHLLEETTEDNANRYNYRRRLEEKLGSRTDLAVWNNLVLRDAGFI